MRISDIASGAEVHLRVRESTNIELFSGLTAPCREDAVLTIFFDSDTTKLLDSLESVDECALIYVDQVRNQVWEFTDIVIGNSDVINDTVSIYVLENALGMSCDRRSWPRYVIDWSAAFESEMTQINGALTLSDISRYGLGMNAQFKLPIGDKLKIQLLDRNTKKRYSIKAKIVRRSLEIPGLWHYGLYLEQRGEGLGKIIQNMETHNESEFTK